ncbi:MAG: hypothetical protein JWP40_4041 [Blastococcus sp.]|jgi:hypothetical protein|nr:hypothetical protein [Blastococcus sp.]
MTAAGHRDKALEYGKDMWMRYMLPTQHYLQFGVQTKRGKLDASGVTKAGNASIAEIHDQALMMLAHERFGPETNKRVLVDDSGCAPSRRCAIVPAIVIHRQEVRPMNAVSAVGAPLQFTIARLR